MALQFSYELNNTSLIANEAYAKISSLRCTAKESDLIMIEVDIFYSASDRENEKDTIHSMGLIISSEAPAFIEFFPNGLSSNNLFECSYEYLKSIPLFSEAIDV